MKNFNKYISLAVASVVGIAFATSCDTSKDNDFVTEYEGAPGVYFSNTANAYLELSEDKNTITYPVYRDEAGPELTVAIEVYPVDNYEADDIYTFPSSVTFAAGSKVADFVIGYDISKAEIGVEQQYELYLDAEPNPFSTNEVVITLVNPAPWTLLGNGEFYDYFFGISDDSIGPAIVSVWQQGLDKNLYRISNPYVAFNGDTESYFQFRVLQEGDVFFGTTVDRPDLVGYTMYFITYFDYWGSDAYIAFPAYFGLTSTADWADSRVLDYREDGLPGLIQLTPVYLDYSSGDGYGYDPSYPILIYFPDYEPIDTSLNVTYEGILTPSSMIQQVLLSVDLGSDITSARAAVALGSDANGLIQDIQEGKVDYTEFNQSGSVQVKFGNENPTGNYTAAVVAYIGEEVKATQTVKFQYISSGTNYDPNEGWKSLGLVNYTDGFVCSCPVLFLPQPLVTYSLEVQQSEETPGLHRLVNPYGAAYPFSDVEEDNPYLPHYLYFDISDPTRVRILESPQDLVLYVQDSNGNIFEGAGLRSCWSLADYYLQNEILTPDQIADFGYYGTYNNGRVTFPRAKIQSQNGQQYIDSPLVADWTFYGDPEDDGMYSANIVMDYDSYEKSGYTDPYMYTLTGAFVNPFVIDMSSISTDANYSVNGQVMLSQRAFKANTPKTVTIQQKANKTIVKKTKKVERQILKKNPDAKLKLQK